MLAGCTAVLNLQAIARHSQGASRMNVGVFESGTGRNVTPDIAVLKLETRGATTDINDYMIERTKTILKVLQKCMIVPLRLQNKVKHRQVVLVMI